MKNEIRELSHSKCGCPQGHVGSNPTFSANKACNCNGYRLLNFLEIAVLLDFQWAELLNTWAELLRFLKNTGCTGSKI